MIIEVENIPIGLQLNQWHKVRQLNGLFVSDMYVRFLYVWDSAGNRVTEPPYDQPGYLEMEYNEIGYP